jgi:SAM-dependent methyltransferase
VGADVTQAPGRYHEVHLPEDPARARVWRVIADHLRGLVPRDATVLEIGAGYCAWINAVEARRRIAVDAWPDVARHAEPAVETLVLDLSEGLAHFSSGSIDVVLASNVLEHFEPDAVVRLVDEVVRVLRPGGRFIVVQPNFRYAYREYFDDYTHRSTFTHVSLANLLRSRGLHVEEVRPRFLPYSMRSTRVPVASWLVKAYLHSPIKPRAGQMLVVARKD